MPLSITVYRHSIFVPNRVRSGTTSRDRTFVGLNVADKEGVIVDKIAILTKDIAAARNVVKRLEKEHVEIVVVPAKGRSREDATSLYKIRPDGVVLDHGGVKYMVNLAFELMDLQTVDCEDMIVTRKYESGSAEERISRAIGELRSQFCARRRRPLCLSDLGGGCTVRDIY